MLKNLIVLPDGTEIASGLGAKHTIQSTTVTCSVNTGTELTPGSVCSSALEAKFFTPGGNLNISFGTEVSLYKVADDGTRTRVGLYTLEAPERPSKNTYKITAYDRVSWLDRDLTVWLSSLDGWPYSLLTFAQMVCEECLLTLATSDIPNANFPVNKFPSSKITGRELMGYIGQLAGRFCRATADGEIEFAWYTDSGVTLTPAGDRYFFSLKYEDYQVEKIEAVQIRLADSEYGALWPEKDGGLNSYVISGNPLITVVNSDLLEYLDVLRREIEYSIYTPCKVTLPANLDIQPGHIVRIVDTNGYLIDTYVMTKTQKGQKETLESTGSARRDSTTAVNNEETSDSELKQYANAAASAAVKNQTQLDIFNKLTNNGAIQGLFIESDGQIYINASFIKTGSLNADLIQSGTMNADLIKAGILQSEDGESFVLDLIKNTFSMTGTGKFMAPDGKSYITIEGNTFCLYAQQGDEDGDFKPIARIGFSEDSEGYDYPYVLLGNDEDESSSRLGLVKQFANGIYIGNSAPRLSTGSFVGLMGAVGFFVNTQEGRTYNVLNEELYDAFTAVFA